MSKPYEATSNTAKAIAYKVIGSVQRAMPEMCVGLAKIRLAVEVDLALQEAGIQSALTDPRRRKLVDALLDCVEMCLNEGEEYEEVLARTKATLSPLYRGVGK